MRQGVLWQKGRQMHQFLVRRPVPFQREMVLFGQVENHIRRIRRVMGGLGKSGPRPRQAFLGAGAFDLHIRDATGGGHARADQIGRLIVIVIGHPERDFGQLCQKARNFSFGLGAQFGLTGGRRPVSRGCEVLRRA